MSALLSSAERHSDRAAALVHLLLLYGCRIGEALGADVDDVHGPAGRRRLRILTKGAVVRELALTPTTARLLEQLVDGRRHGPLLPSTTGRRWHRTNAARLLQTLGRQALDPAVAQRLHPHALRRAFVDAGLQAGASLTELQYALGHCSTGMVLLYASRHAHGRDPVTWRVTDLLHGLH